MLYERCCVLTQLHTYFPWSLGLFMQAPYNSMRSKQGSMGAHCFSFTDIHALSSLVLIYTPGSREAIEIKHFAQECKHGQDSNPRPFDRKPNS